jgi:hypothetical protein
MNETALLTLPFFVVSPPTATQRVGQTLDNALQVPRTHLSTQKLLFAWWRAWSKREFERSMRVQKCPLKVPEDSYNSI